ncbi:hypothetical protein [Prevotellamassilia timonensis]|uniref:hypothetical protein n=1 Tax=Prevotellamassilia timonensis TaxID=1852370 RepID=UPI00307AF4DA
MHTNKNYAHFVKNPCAHGCRSCCLMPSYVATRKFQVLHLGAFKIAIKSNMLHDKELGLHLMSDTYIVNDLIEDLRRKQYKGIGKPKGLTKLNNLANNL